MTLTCHLLGEKPSLLDQGNCAIYRLRKRLNLNLFRLLHSPIS